MPQHPDPHIRRAVRVLATVGELHKRGYQRLRVMPFMSPSGVHWRCWISPVNLFYRNHGAILLETAGGTMEDVKMQATATIAGYTSGQDNHYFGWNDAEQDDARSLADKFLDRFRMLTDRGNGWDYPYAGWYQRLLSLAKGGWLPVVLADDEDVSWERVPLRDVRPQEWRVDGDVTPILPLPPPGELQRDYTG